MEPLAIEKTEAANKSAKRDVKPTPTGVRVALPEGVVEKVQKTLAQLKERGAELKADDLLTALFKGLDDDYLNNQLDLLTPPSFYLERAKEHTELYERLILQARMGLMRVGRGENPIKARKKRTLTGKSEAPGAAN